MRSKTVAGAPMTIRAIWSSVILLALMFHRNRQGIFDAPSTLENSRSDCLVGNASGLSSLLERVRSHLRWSRESFFCAPSISNNSEMNKVWIKAGQFRCFRHGHFIAIENNHAVAPCISSLLSRSRPAAVIRRIAFVIVDSIKAMSVWTRPHGQIKRLETSPPFIADSYAARAIGGIFRIRFAIAPLFHALPCGVFRSVIHSQSIALDWSSVK